MLDALIWLNPAHWSRDRPLRYLIAALSQFSARWAAGYTHRNVPAICLTVGFE